MKSYLIVASRHENASVREQVSLKHHFFCSICIITHTYTHTHTIFLSFFLFLSLFLSMCASLDKTEMLRRLRRMLSATLERLQRGNGFAGQEEKYSTCTSSNTTTTTTTTNNDDNINININTRSNRRRSCPLSPFFPFQCVSHAQCFFYGDS